MTAKKQNEPIVFKKTETPKEDSPQVVTPTAAELSHNASVEFYTKLLSQSEKNKVVHVWQENPEASNPTPPVGIEEDKNMLPDQVGYAEKEDEKE